MDQEPKDYYINNWLKLAFVLVCILFALLVIIVGKAGAQPPTDKYDEDCAGVETIGRCADKPLISQPAPSQPTTTPVVVEHAPTNSFSGK